MKTLLATTAAVVTLGVAANANAAPTKAEGAARAIAEDAQVEATVSETETSDGKLSGEKCWWDPVLGWVC